MIPLSTLHPDYHQHTDAITSELRPWRTLALAVIEQAIFDYKAAAHAGVVKRGKLQVIGERFRFKGDLEQESRVGELLYFLQSRTLDELLDLAGCKLSASAIRRGLLTASDMDLPAQHWRLREVMNGVGS